MPVSGVGDWFSDLIGAGERIGETALTGQAPGTTSAGGTGGTMTATGAGAGTPPAAQPKSNLWLWVGVGVGSLALVYLITKRRRGR